MPVNGRRLFVALFALVVAACQPQGELETRVVSGSHDDRMPRASLSVEAKRSGAAIAAQSVPDREKRHFIEFRSRYALSYGHTFVIYGRLNEAGQMVNPQVAGLAPKSDDPSVYLLGHVMPVPASTGLTDGDLEDEYMSANWRVMLSEAEYNKVAAFIRELRARSPVWQAALYNCNAFVADIARFMDYKAPAIWLRPKKFVTRLREMNGGPNAIGTTVPDAASAG
jgi:hypothetical protein